MGQNHAEKYKKRGRLGNSRTAPPKLPHSPTGEATNVTEKLAIDSGARKGSSPGGSHGGGAA